MDKLLLLGDEAIAQGALDAGISGVYAYPGTPSSEITAYIQDSLDAVERNVQRRWCVNEKTAMEAALGMSYAGKRALVCMKHVGLNVAADPFVNSAITGANGGIVLTVADDPSMHSSQNEQDSRFYAKFAMVPLFEPSNQQETYDMMFAAYELSEKFSTPVMIRITTRLAHSRSGVETRKVLPENGIKLPEDRMQFLLLPSVARQRYKRLLGLQKYFEEESENSPYNVYQDGPDTSRGFIACGLAYNYLMENYQDGGCPHPILKVSQYPLPRAQIEKIVSQCDEIVVLEEGAPLVENMLKGYLGDFFQPSATLDAVGTDHGKASAIVHDCPPIKGRLDGTLPRDGELNPGIVRVALRMDNLTGSEIPAVVTNRPPALCKGCSHIDSYNALNEAMHEYGPGHVFSDIGCYTLGFLPPYNAINTCVDMGASITMARGAADAGLFPAVAVIGDSTFIHSGITGLIDAIETNTNIVVMILENSTTAMTGGQDYPAMGRIQRICEGVGVAPEHLRVVTPLKKFHDDMVQVIKEELAYTGVSVIIPCRECIHTLSKKRA